MKSFYLKCLVFEIITLVCVALSFIFIANPFSAGMVAAVFFISIGIFVCYKGLNSNFYRKTYTFLVGVVHLTLTLIMVATRLTHPDTAFTEIHFAGIPGPVFHQISTWVFYILIAATVVDYFKSRKVLSN